ncbi:hypothetical protein NEOC84_001149|nr:hypothetical protein [Neochlamydia sp. AcF95]NGY95236.1 hypothetical protein [Neochlamydia sp. AcF84]
MPLIHLLWLNGVNSAIIFACAIRIRIACEGEWDVKSMVETKPRKWAKIHLGIHTVIFRGQS